MAIDQFLDALAIVDPQRIVSKPKCHILTHIVKDIERYGSSIALTVETFESFNSVFHLCSILSNHQAPSRDIALNLADIGRFKHVVSGGYWKEDDKWVNAGVEIRRFFQNNRILQQYLGWSDPNLVAPGIFLTLLFCMD